MKSAPNATSIKEDCRLATKVFLFIDNSNIFISAQDEAYAREGSSARLQARLQFDNMIKLAHAQRSIGGICVVGSIPPDQKAMWKRLEQATGVRPELFERGKASGSEQGVDQCLQVHMLRAISDNAEPQIAVLMTGDGSGYDNGVGFHADLERMHANGWGIEVISWRNHCKRDLRDWAMQVGVFVPMDDYYNSITFLEGARTAKPLDLSLRALAKARRSPIAEAEAKAQRDSEARISQLQHELQEMKDAGAKKAARKARYDRSYARGARTKT